MKKKIFVIISVSLILAMLCILPSFAYLERKIGTVGTYSVVGSIWGSDSSGYYANTYVNSSARGQIGYIYAKLWLRTTSGSPQTVTNSSSNANTIDCDSLPGINPTGAPISARSWNYVRLLNGSTWGNMNTNTSTYLDYTIEYIFP